MPNKTSSKRKPTTEPFSLIPTATQRSLYDHVSRALQNRGDDKDHNDVAEIAAAMALRQSDVIVAPGCAAGLRIVRESAHAPAIVSPNQFAASLTSAVGSLFEAPADSVALLASSFVEETQGAWQAALSFLGRTRLPLLILIRTVTGPKSQTTSVDLRTVYAEFGVPVITVDANDAIAVYRVATEAAHNSRVGRGATIIEATYVPSTMNGVESPSPLKCLEGYMRRHGAWHHPEALR